MCTEKVDIFLKIEISQQTERRGGRPADGGCSCGFILSGIG